MSVLQKKTFGGWPETKSPSRSREIASEEHDGVRLSVHEFESQPGVRLRFYLARPVSGAPAALHLETVDGASWRQQLELARAGFPTALKEEFAAAGVKTDAPVPTEAAQHLARWMRYIKDNKSAYITFTPRGVGMTALSDDKKYQIQVRRRFMLLGQTLAGMQVWDVRRAAQAARQVQGLANVPLHFHAGLEMTEVATFAAVFELGISTLTLAQAPRPDKEAPDFLNWSRIMTPQQLLSLAQEKCKVNLETRSEQQNTKPEVR